MRQTTQGVSLQAVLERVFADQPRHGGTACANTNGASIAVPATRTSEDRSRMRQKVLEELARRKQARQGAGEATVEPTIVPDTSTMQVEQSLFHADAPVCRERRSAVQCSHAVAAPRVGARSRGDIREVVATAYRSLMRRLPEDHVVLNPIANAEFIVRCRDLGATVSEVVLNRTLLN
ncbi:MAG: hypothetical protein KIT68_09060, partial [Phycisphaeraceae bacterium]|nr:hypothetical protein [Phycisphaeraceae bacterium]